MPTAAELAAHADRLVQRTAAERPLPAPVSAGELAWVRSLVRSVELTELALTNAASRIVTLTVVELFRHGAATVLHVAIAHAKVLWTAEYRRATEGRDRWRDDERAALLRTLQHMAYDVAERRGYCSMPYDEGDPFGVRLAHLRARAGLTQAELAAALDTSTSGVRNWEAGRYFPQLPRVQQLCTILSCSLRDLLG